MRFKVDENLPAEEFRGVVVIRSGDQSKSSILGFVPRIIAALEEDAVDRKLWIVEENRTRVRGAE